MNCKCGRDSRKTGGIARKSRGAAGWIVPSAALALMPKCPMCIAAYFALISGVGISISAATHLRWMMIVACCAWLLWFFARSVSRMIHPIAADAGSNHEHAGLSSDQAAE